MVHIRRCVSIFKKIIIEILIRSLYPSRVLNRVKRFILLKGGAIINKNVSIDVGVIIRNLSDLSVGENCVISAYCVLICKGGLEIKNNVLIGYGTKILTQNHDISDKESLIRFSGHNYGRVVIHDNVWIGANAVILPGVEIGEGAVIGAGAVVTKNIPAYTVYGGVPAKLIKER